MSKQEQNAVNRQCTNIPAPLACPFCGQDKTVRCGVRKTRSCVFDYYSFNPSPDLIGLHSPVSPQASVPAPRAVHPIVQPEGKRPAEESTGVSLRPPKTRQRWTAPKGFNPRKEITSGIRGGNTR